MKKENKLSPTGSVLIKSFSIKNFLSFRKETVMDFCVPKSQASYGWVWEREHLNNIALVEAIYGANASGKTNFLKGLAFLGAFISNSFNITDSNDLGVRTWANNKAPTHFKLILEDSVGVEYRYFLSISCNKVLEESLYVRLPHEKGKGTLILQREHRKKNIFIHHNVTDFDFLKLIDIPRNASLLSTFFRGSKDSPWKKLNYFRGANVQVSGRIPPRNIEFGASQWYLNNSKLKKTMEEYIQKFDLGIDSFKITPLNDERIRVVGIHTSSSGEKFEISLSEESGGTRTLYALLPLIIDALENGGVAVIDEIEGELHPDMAAYLIELFADPEVNRRQAQLIFTTHLPDIMDQLGKNLTWIVERKNAESSITALSQIGGVRMDENHSRKYRAGVYGGVPNLQ